MFFLFCFHCFGFDIDYLLVYIVETEIKLYVWKVSNVIHVPKLHVSKVIYVQVMTSFIQSGRTYDEISAVVTVF